VILDSISNIQNHSHLHPGFQIVADYLKENDLNSFSLGKHVITEDAIFVNIEECEGRGKSGARLEAHRAYIDIQFCLNNHDVIGLKSLSECTTIHEEYDIDRDILFFSDVPETWVTINETQCAILFPDDAHAPLAAEENMKKAVFKIKV